MSWVREMERDAVAVAFPDWEWDDSDIVTVGQEWDSGYAYSSYTYEDPSFKISVDVRRDDDLEELPWGQNQQHRWTDFTRDEAAEFWAKLMQKGSER